MDTSRPTSTADLIQGLRLANPDRNVTDGTVRWPIRTRRLKPPQRFGTFYMWSAPDIRALCDELGLKPPAEVRP